MGVSNVYDFFASQNPKLVYSFESLPLKPMQGNGGVYLTMLVSFRYMEWSLSLVRNCVEIVSALISESALDKKNNPKFHMEKSISTTKSNYYNNI